MVVPPLLRSAVVDRALLRPLERLIFGPLEPTDLGSIEMGLRAFLLADGLRVLPVIDSEAGVWHSHDRGEDDADPPIGDAILDYEFRDTNEVPPLPMLPEDERVAIDDTVLSIIAAESGKKLEQLTEGELRALLAPIAAEYLRVAAPQYWQVPPRSTENAAIRDMLLLAELGRYARTLVRFHRAGAVVFSENIIGRACQRHLFSEYPLRLFGELDAIWQAQLRQVTGPGVGVTIPPVLALVLSRVKLRGDISLAIRDIREEYAASRNSLWEHLEAMWFASSLKKQLALRADLEKAGKDLFRAAFPERFPFLQTAWSTTVLVADMKLGSAADQLGKALLKHDEPQAHVSAIGFAGQLSGDLRDIDGMNNLLRKILSPVERAGFGLS